MKLLSIDINFILKKVFARQHPLLGEIVINWRKIVGDRFADKSSPSKISSMREKGQNIDTLHINVQNSSLATEMRFQQEIILERLAIYLGFKGIKGLYIRNINS